MTLISTNISRPRPAIAKGISSTALPLRPCSSSPSASALRYDELRSVHKRVSTRTYGVAYEEVVGKASPPVERRYIDIGGQNAEGFKSEEKWEELAMKVRRWKMFAVCIQETWRHGDCQLESHGVYFIGHGYAEPKCLRGSGGVGIMLSEEAKEAWIAAGSVVLHFGSRIMAIRLTLMDARDRAVELMLVSAYAPTSSHSAAERQAYADNEDRCFKACRPNEVLVMMADVNASLGVQQPAADGEDADTVLGPFGLPRVNPLEKALHKRLTSRKLCAASTFFDHGKAYATFRHKKTNSAHQIDHAIVKRKDMKRVTDAKVWRRFCKADHRGLWLRLKVARRLKRRRPPNVRQRVNRDLLKDPEIRSKFVDAFDAAVVKKGGVTRRTRATEHVAESEYDAALRRDLGTEIAPEMTAEGALAAIAKEALAREMTPTEEDDDATRSDVIVDGDAESGYDAALRRDLGTEIAPEKTAEGALAAIARAAIARAAIAGEAPATKVDDDDDDATRSGAIVNSDAKVDEWIAGLGYGDVLECMQEAECATLTETTRRRKGWFEAEEEMLYPLILDRDRAQVQFDRSPSKTSRLKLALARIAVKRAVQMAKDAWIRERVAMLNTGKRADGSADVRNVWRAVESLKNGLSSFKTAVYMKLRKPNGELSNTDAENLEILDGHFGKVLNIDSPFDLSVLDLVKQREIRWDLNDPPTAKEVITAIKGMRNGKAAGDSVPVEYLKALIDGDALDPFLAVVRDFWDNGMCPDMCTAQRMVVLPKKGDRHNVAKWRGIFLMDLLCKVLSKIFTTRLNSIMKQHGLEYQNGFTAGRGTPDGTSLLMQTLWKRHEHNQGSWAVFIDLVKAFPSVNRTGLWAVLAKFGVPPRLLARIERLHTGVVAKFKMGEDEIEIANTSGSKQGCPMAAVLFAFLCQACNETLPPRRGLKFKTAAEGKEGTAGRGVTGANWKKRTDSTGFEVEKSLYADDEGDVYESRAELQTWLRVIHAHMDRWGLTMHVGRNGKASKTEAMYFPAPGEDYDDADTSPLEVDGGQVPFTRRFTYLGSVVASSLSSEPDVTVRINKATAVFGALRKCVFGTRDVSIDAKRQVYITLVLSVLLYGSECWTLRAEDRNRLRVFHRKCVRTMMGVSRRKQQKTHITNEELNERCKLESMDFYLRAKALRWAGHVVRMPYDRLPRKLFFGWVEHPRARGARLTYGRRIEQLVKDALALAEPDVRRAIMGTSRSTRRRSSSSSQRKACGWVEFARERNRWRRLVNAGKRFSKKLPTSSKNGNGKNGGGGNGKYLSAEVAAAVAADVARALAARDR